MPAHGQKRYIIEWLEPTSANLAIHADPDADLAMLEFESREFPNLGLARAHARRVVSRAMYDRVAIYTQHWDENFYAPMKIGDWGDHEHLEDISA